MTDADDLYQIELKAKEDQEREIEERRKARALESAKKTDVTVVPSSEALLILPKNITDVKELAKIATPHAIQALVNIALNEEAPPAARVSAAMALIDRGHGKAAASLEVSGKLTLLQLVQESMKIDHVNSIEAVVEEESVI